jgi:hypothetical protein
MVTDFQGRTVYLVFQPQYVRHLDTPVNALYGPTYLGCMLGWVTLPRVIENTVQINGIR